jgi:hypothetical protein
MKMNHVELLSLLKDNRWEKVIKAKWPINPTGYWLSRLADHMEQLEKAYWRSHAQVIKRHAEMNDDGSVKTGPGGAVAFPSPEVEAECRREIGELGELEVEMKYVPIKVDLNRIPDDLTPADLAVVLRFLDVKEGEEEISE